MGTTQTYFQKAKQVTFVSLLTNFGLAIIKILAGIFGHSHALVADAIHSFADVLSDIFVLIAAYFGSKAADQDHPYGHGRIETLATVALSILIILAGAGIVWDAIAYISRIKNAVSPSSFALLVAIISVIANECLYRYTLNVAKQHHSALLEANAWHNRSDVFSAIIVLIGVAGSMLGLANLDSLAAIFIAIYIFKMGGELIWQSLRELVDTGLDSGQVKQISEIIQKVEGVHSLHQLRTRKMGKSILLDVHILVNPFISVSEGHYIGEQVAKSIRQHIPQVCDVTLHIDPEDDEQQDPNIDLPSRKEIIKQIKQRCRELPGINQAQFTIHYLNGQVLLVLKIPLAAVESYDLSALSQQYRQIIAADHNISDTQVCFQS